MQDITLFHAPLCTGWLSAKNRYRTVLSRREGTKCTPQTPNQGEERFSPMLADSHWEKLKKAGFLKILVVVEKMLKQALTPCQRPGADLSLSGLTSKIHVYGPKKFKDEKPKKTGMPEIFVLE